MEDKNTMPEEFALQVKQAAEMQAKVAEQAKALKRAQEEIDATWDQVKGAMIRYDVKSIKGDWGSITVAERTTYKAADLSAVPGKFIKKALDTSKVAAAAQLEGKLPKGVEASVTQYLTKRIK